MLGWQVYVKQESDTLIASWCVGLGGLDWLDGLVKQGLAQELGGNGYPCKYIAKAGIILPKIIPFLPINENAMPTLGDDYIIDTNDSWDVNIKKELAMCCKPTEILIIEAWDLS